MWAAGAGLILLLLNYCEVVQCVCNRGFSERKVEVEIAPHVSKGEVILTVQFRDCALGKNVRFSTNDEGFEVDGAGVVRAVQTRNVDSKHEFKVLAEDLETCETWAVEIQLIALKKTELVKRSLEVIRFPPKRSSRQQKRNWITPPLDMIENEKPKNPIAVIVSDYQDTPGVKITYTIVGQGANEPPIGLFVIDAHTGELNATRAVDREQYSHFRLIGHAHDQNKRLMEEPIELLVKVLDVNDNPPIFTQPVFEASIEELSELGTLVLQLNATDADEGRNALIHYRVTTQGIEAFSATVDGKIKVMDYHLDRETQGSYTFTVEARDRGGSAEGLKTTAKAQIKILDVNDNIPSVDQFEYTADVKENTKEVEVLRIKVSDKDLEFTDNWLAHLIIIEGNEGEHYRFEVDNRTNEGILIVQKELNYEENDLVNLVVRVSNKAPFHHSVPHNNIVRSIKITLHVVDVVEGFEFQPSKWRVSIRESTTSKTIRQVLGRYPAVSADTGKANTMTKYAKDSDEANWLVVNPENGEITFVGVPDRESKYVINGTYTATILAINNEHNHASTSTGTIVIRLEDANDHVPTFENLHPCICSNSKSLNLTAFDLDGHPYGAPFHFEVNSNNKWKLGRTDATCMELVPLMELWPGTFAVLISVKDNDGNGHLVNLDVRVADCRDSTMCSAEKIFQSQKAFLGGAAVGLMILALLLLLLVPLLLLFCQCGGGVGGKRGFIAISDLPKGSLGEGNFEGGGTVDTIVPLIPAEEQLGMSLKAKGMIDSDGMAGSDRMITSGRIVVSSVVQTDGRHEGRKWTDSDHQVSDVGSGQHISIRDGTVHYKSTGSSARNHNWSRPWSSGRILEGSYKAFMNQYINEKLLASTADSESHAARDILLVYSSEGNNSPTGSLGSCACLEDVVEGDSFLDDLDPKFRTLAEICGGRRESQHSAAHQSRAPELTATIDSAPPLGSEMLQESVFSETMQLRGVTKEPPAPVQRHVVVTTTINPSRGEPAGLVDPLSVQSKAVASTVSGAEEWWGPPSITDPALPQEMTAPTKFDSGAGLPAAWKSVVETRSVNSSAGEIPDMILNPPLGSIPRIQKNVITARSVRSSAGETQGAITEPSVGLVPLIQKNVVVRRPVGSAAGGLPASSFYTEPAIAANLVTGKSGGGTYRSVKRVSKTVQLVQE
ncbi:desmoglein-2-like [Mustelus asterias]